MFFKRLFSSSNLPLQINDGGRAAAGYKGKAGDCVVRSIAIATGVNYEEVYEDLYKAKELGDESIATEDMIYLYCKKNKPKKKKK